MTAVSLVGRRLRELRGQLGLRQTDVAARSGIPGTTLSKIENGKLPGFDVAAKLAAAFGLSAEDLLLSSQPPGYPDPSPAALRNAPRRRLRPAFVTVTAPLPPLTFEAPAPRVRNPLGHLEAPR